jgi:hypothetical protein
MTRLTKRNLLFAVPVMIVLISLRIGTNSDLGSDVTGVSHSIDALRAAVTQADGEPVAVLLELKKRTMQTAQTRSSIWGASDIMAAVRRAQRSGTPDEKWFAQEVLRECALFTEPPAAPIAAAIEGTGKYGQRAAWAELEMRCAGIKALSWDQRRALVADLKQAAVASTTTMKALFALTERLRSGDNLWSQIDLDAITAALHGHDPIPRREAFGILLSSIDKNESGGQARYEGLMFLMAADDRNEAQSDFELLERCAIFPNCASDGSQDPPATSDSLAAVDSGYERLKALYAEAFAKRISAARILAIR